jgi:small subunit ribosomal protein S2
MAAYIYGKRNQIHIIDIKETLKGLLRGKKFLAKVVAAGQDVLFVGTKRQAKHLIVDHANKINMPYVSERWLGGTLTNFRTIRSRLTRLEELERLEADGSLENYSKKMKATLLREMAKMKRNLEGIRRMNRLPGALIVVDVKREHIAVKEARKLKIPTVCLTDTDSDPDFADIVIPGNDDAIRSIDTVLGNLAEAIQAGLRGRPEKTEEEQEPGGARRRRRKTTSAMAEELTMGDEADQEGLPAMAGAEGVAPAADQAVAEGIGQAPAPASGEAPVATGGPAAVEAQSNQVSQADRAAEPST